MKFKKIFNKAKDLFISNKLSPELEKKFRETLLYSNSKRIIKLSICIIIFTATILILELAGLIQWNSEILAFQLSVIYICIIMGIVIFILRKNKKTKSLLIAVSSMHIIYMIAACAYTSITYIAGNRSFDGYIISSFIIFLTFIRKKYISITLYIVPYLLLTYYLVNKYEVNMQMIIEIINVTLFVFLICIGSIFHYNWYKKLFIQKENMKKANEKLEFLSTTDELTQINNRRKIYHELIR